MLLETLSKALPNRVVAQSNDAACSGIFSGVDPDKRRSKSFGRQHVQHIDPHGGGYGARPMRDGVNAIRVLVGNAGITSVEQVEHFAPLTVDSWRLVTDSGGAGRWRGGLTSERVYEVGFDEATLTVIAERGRVAPKGLFGGLEGGFFKASVVRAEGGAEEIPSKGAHVIVKRNDRVYIRPAGGGGYGDPLEREPERVLLDMMDGYVSEKAARDLYGVAIDTETRTIDWAVTERLRSDRRSKVA
jgi:N-methylhydantoinase B